MKNILLSTIAVLLYLTSFSQESPKEEDYYKIVTLPVPEGVLLEVGGICTMPNGNVALATRRGEVWIVENPSSRSPFFRKYASGLHEILGLMYTEGSFYCAQRGELTKLSDYNGDGKADAYETVHAWQVSGHYHEYSFGPKPAPDGSFFVSGNVAFGDQEWWRGESRAKTRGTIFKVWPDGRYEPWAAGMRSPAGLGMIDGDLFYSDNQGDWMGSGGVWHVKKGAFVGHPASLKWVDDKHPVKLNEKQFFAERDNRKVKTAGGEYIKPENIVAEKTVPLYQLKDKYPAVQTPAVWLPHGILGVSNSEIIKIQSLGNFGPFENQLLVGDQGQSKIMRVQLEKINGEFQGAAWDFRAGFQSGVMRMVFAGDGSLFVGETNRGWGSAGDANQGLQRLVWNGKMPFEMLSCSAMPDGFEIKFSMPIDKKSALGLESIVGSSFIYKHHPAYGSPPVEKLPLTVKGIKVADDGMSLRIVMGDLRRYYIHELNLSGIRSMDKSWSLVHPTVFYTLNNIPEGTKLKDTEVSKVPAKAAMVESKKVVSNAGSAKVPTFNDVKGLLQKNTCLACHAEDKKVVGPAFREIAKRNYSAEKIVQLIYQPKPENWPDYATPMAAMPQVPKAEALQMAKYIIGLKKETL